MTTEGSLMSKAEQKVVQYLGEAYASEVGLVSVLRSQIAMTPRGSYRDELEKHLGETQAHARRIRKRSGELGQSRNPVQVFVGFAETLIAQSVALGKTPFDLLRGSGGEEKILKNAKDACATEALEIATYSALERLATGVGDEQTARLAASIRGDEERMLARIMREIPKLTERVVGADVEGRPTYDITKSGAADATRETAREVKQAARGAQARANRTARQARKVPGVAQAEGHIKGAVASEEDLAIARYDSLTAEQILGKLPELSQIDLAKVDAYERKNDNRTTILSRIAAPRRHEPWPGYDELTVAEVGAVIGEGDRQRTKDVAAYERAHKNRAGVLRSAERETVNA
jgi:ferritin-like metal-binding protein YciE